MKSYLTPDWKKAPRWFSVQAATLLIAWAFVPPDQQAALLEWVGLAPERVPAILGLLVIVGRLFNQGDDK